MNRTEAMTYLLADGNLAVPCSRYGSDTEDCAPVASRVAEIYANESGEPITVESLDHAMGLVVNDHDDVEYMIREYGEAADLELLDATFTVKTNNVPRDVLDACELTAAERADFDYLNWPALERGEESASFFRFKGQLYDLGEFMANHDPRLAGWDGHQSDTFFSATLVRFVEHGERVVVGRVYS